MRPAALLLALALTACSAGGPDAERPADRSPAQVVAGVQEAAREAGTVTYASVTRSAREGEQEEVEARITGELDLRAGTGTADIELLPLDDLAAAAQGDDPAAAADLAAMARVRMSWTAEEVTVELGGRTETQPRSDDDSALFARVPGEPAGLLAVVAGAREVQEVGAEEVDGVPATHYRGVVDPAQAVEQGLGTQAQLAIADLPSLPVEVWVDGQGRPARIRYTATTPSLQGATRTSATTYDYTGWGD